MRITYNPTYAKYTIKETKILLDKCFFNGLSKLEEKIKRQNKLRKIRIDIHNNKQISVSVLLVIYFKTIKIMLEGWKITYDFNLSDIYIKQLRVISIYRKNKLIKKKLFNLLDGKNSFAFITHEDYKKFGIEGIFSDVMQNIYNLDDHNDQIPEEILIPIGESFANAYQHSNDFVFGFSYAREYDQNKLYLVFTIVDFGDSIVETVKKHLNALSIEVNNKEAFEWALKETNTTKQQSGGFGLSNLKKIVSKYDGNLDIVSGDVIYNFHNHKEKYEKLDNYVFGTLISTKIEYNEIDNTLFEPIKDRLNLFNAIN